MEIIHVFNKPLNFNIMVFTSLIRYDISAGIGTFTVNPLAQ